MYFSKDEIIEVKNNEKYLILDCTKISEKEYYKIRKIGTKMDELIGSSKYITVSKENGHLIIEELLEVPLIKEIEEKFTSSIWAFFIALKLHMTV